MYLMLIDLLLGKLDIILLDLVYAESQCCTYLQVCPELKDAARVSQDLFRAWKHDNMGSKALRPIDSRYNGLTLFCVAGESNQFKKHFFQQMPCIQVAP